MTAALIRSAAGLAVLLLAQQARAADLPVRFLQDLATPARFEGHKGAAAQDLSGIACSGVLADGRTRCVVIDDQDAHAQTAAFADGALSPVRVIPLDARPTRETLGAARTFPCPQGAGKNGEIDGEAVAAQGDTFYVVGSHGCSRNGGKFKPSAFQLIRFTLAPDGGLVAPPERTYRVVDLLAQSEAADRLGMDLNTQHGLNIEGLAVRGDDLYVGLRGPGADGTRPALILRGRISDLFAPGQGPATRSLPSLRLPLKAGLGLRDMAALEGGGLLLLTGPETAGDQPYELSIVHPESGCLTPLGPLGDRAGAQGRAKAEGVAVVGRTSGRLRVIVLYDGIVDGGPQLYELAPPETCRS